MSPNLRRAAKSPNSRRRTFRHAGKSRPEAAALHLQRVAHARARREWAARTIRARAGAPESAVGVALQKRHACRARAAASAHRAAARSARQASRRWLDGGTRASARHALFHGDLDGSSTGAPRRRRRPRVGQEDARLFVAGPPAAVHDGGGDGGARRDVAAWRSPPGIHARRPRRPRARRQQRAARRARILAARRCGPSWLRHRAPWRATGGRGSAASARAAPPPGSRRRAGQAAEFVRMVTPCSNMRDGDAARSDGASGPAQRDEVVPTGRGGAHPDEATRRAAGDTLACPTLNFQRVRRRRRRGFVSGRRAGADAAQRVRAAHSQFHRVACRRRASAAATARCASPLPREGA